MGKISIGGQAVIEGVMIRGPTKYSVAVRKGKRIVCKLGSVSKKKHPAKNLPVIRGAVNLWEMLVIGIKCLMWSAEQAEGKGEKLGKKEATFTLAISMLFAIGLFVALPYLFTNLLGFVEETQPVLFNFIDGAIRILIFIGYLSAISLLSDVKILFQYHGAEHKAIHCYEHNKKLSLANVKGFTTLHRRCGTSFIFLVLIISILVFSLLPSIVIYLYNDFVSLDNWARRLILFPLRIAIVPLIAGISYEVLKMSDRKKNNLIFRIISAPGLLLQKITTKEPTNRQIEVAVFSLNRLLKYEKQK